MELFDELMMGNLEIEDPRAILYAALVNGKFDAVSEVKVIPAYEPPPGVPFEEFGSIASCESWNMSFDDNPQEIIDYINAMRIEE